MNVNPLLLLIVVLCVVLAGVAIWGAVIDARADREHLQWMRRNTVRRRRTQVAVRGIRYGRTGLGLDGEADHDGATRKHTEP